MIEHVAAIGAAPDGFWAEQKDLFALIVSLMALGVSLVTTRQNLRATGRMAEKASADAHALSRMATYQRVHELLVDPKASAGRRRLFQAARTETYPGLGEDGWDDINYSLALYDTLAGYVARGQVDEAVVLDAWHHPLSNIAQPVRAFMAHREGASVRQPWAHLMSLLAKAEAYPCTCPQDPPVALAPTHGEVRERSGTGR